jgi:hypothetical protein
MPTGTPFVAKPAGTTSTGLRLQMLNGIVMHAQK